MTETSSGDAPPTATSETTPTEPYPVPTDLHPATQFTCDDLGHGWHPGHLHLLVVGFGGVRLTT